MLIRKSTASWDGDLKKGSGIFSLGSELCQGIYSFQTRFGTVPGTNPEELIGAAHAACYSMALAHELTKADIQPQKIDTEAEIEMIKVTEGYKIKSSTLNTFILCDSEDDEKIKAVAEEAKKNCPISQALAGLDIYLNVKVEE